MISERICNIADRIGSDFGTNDPRELCADMGISFLRYELPESVNGMYFSVGGRQSVIINTSADEAVVPYYTAHELGHAVLHSELNFAFICTKTNLICEKYEHEADLFAAFLLLPHGETGEYDGCTAADIYSEKGIPLRAVEEWAAVRHKEKSQKI